MKFRGNELVFAILCMIPTFISGQHSIYRLRTRVVHHVERKLQQAPSFSGDLDPIIEAAEELAEIEDNLTTPAPPGTPSSDTRIGCEDEEKDKVFYLQFDYEMETLPETLPLDDRDVILQDEPSVLENLEKSLNEALASKLLYCPAIGYTASDEDTGIVAFDSAPDDSPHETKTCGETTNENNVCAVMVGQMSVWYKDTSDSEKDLIEYATMISIRNFLNGDPDVPGLVRTKYLWPPIEEPEPPNGATDGDGEPSDSVSTDTDSGLNNRSIIFMSLASVGFVAAVGLVTYFRMRKSSHEDEVPYVATLENESSGEESPSRLSSSHDDSNFSSIMPSNYRLDVSESPFNSIAPSSMGSMGTIHESDDAHSDGQRSDDMVVSDGYTTEGDSSIEFPSYFGNNYVANAAPVLGARPRTEEELEESHESSAAF